MGVTNWPERRIDNAEEPESSLRDRGESTAGRNPLRWGPDLWLIETVLAETQTGMVRLKGAGYERGSTLQYSEFLRRVEEQIAANRSVSDARREAENATTATLETLNERITGGEARDLAAQLPKEIQPALQPKAEEAEGFSLEEFYRRVAEREGVDIETARIDASAVMRVLREAVTPGELDDVMAQLPEDFNALLR
jgi:uncharacterized protein (DUF2267 family)